MTLAPLKVGRGFDLDGGKITGSADGVDPTDLATVGQIPAGSLPDPSAQPDGSWLRTASGTAIWVPAPTTADVPDSTNRRYLTDAQQTAVGSLGSAAFHDDGDFDPAGAAAAAAAASQPLDSDLTAIAALTTTSFGRALLALADAGAMRAAAGLGTAATSNTGDFDAAGAAAAAQAASQPLDSDLTAIAALSTTTYGRSLLEAANAAALRTLAGLGSAATAATGDFDAAGAAAAAQAASQPLDSDLTAIAGLDSSTAGAISSDGAGWVKKTYSQFKTALSLVKGDVGLGNVDNTADTAKPVSTAQQTAIDAKVSKSLYDANTVLAADADDTPAEVTMGASTILARLAAGNIKAATPAELRTLLALVIGTDVASFSDARLSDSRAPSGSAGGDLTGTYPNPTLAAAGGGAAGPTGSATVTPIVTVDAKGRVTALSSATIAATNAAGGDLTGNYPNPTLATAGPGATGPIGSATVVPVVTIDAKGRVTGLTSAVTDLSVVGGQTDFVLASNDVSSAATTLRNLSGFVWTMVANAKYVVDLWLLVSPTAATTGLGLTFDVSVAVTFSGITFTHSLATTGTLSGGDSIADAATRSLSSGLPATGNSLVKGKGLVLVGANGGTCQLQWQPEIAAVSQITAGSIMTVRRVA